MLNLNGHLPASPLTLREVSASGTAVSNERDFATENETFTFVKTNVLTDEIAKDSDDAFWESLWAVVPDTDLTPLHRS